ncbi:GNAT family N-acetyltransferase [Streptomyces sp. NPDC006879]|uniref:GNAT family N-acetyltransferase n=1 Tax=Streptomyces sp. NPDC006879 TaxID=3364767 RepID=UPI00367B0044
MTPSQETQQPSPRDLEVRTVQEAELASWLGAVHVGFLTPPAMTEADVALRAKQFDPSRTLGAFESPEFGGGCVATFRSFPQQISVPGGSLVPASAVSQVTVAPTHRRRGLLTRMMATELVAAKERGEVLATLVAAEYPIYGRYGFGPAAHVSEWEIEVGRAGLDRRWSRPDCGGRIDLVDGAQVCAVGPGLHNRRYARRAGVISRDAQWWSLNTGLEELSHRPWKGTFFALYRAPDGEPEGVISYRADDKWADAKVPDNTVTVLDITAATVRAERALWHFVCSIDWVQKVRTCPLAPDDLLPQFLPDPRSARLLTHADYLWVRLLDVVRALEARTYAAAGSLVLEVVDEAGLAGGRFRLDAAPDGSVCAPTDEQAELTLTVADLASLYLGDASALRLAELGRITEHAPGAIASAELLFRTALRPWCPDLF